MKSIYIYIHYPFCSSICPYCNFYSLVNTTERNSAKDQKLFDLYKSQLDYYYNFSNDAIVQTIFFGGGTPSLASIDLLSNIINYIYTKWKVTVNPEISIEVNPFSSSPENFLNYKSIGINRISIGVQSLNDNELKFLGRLHSAKIALQTIENAYKYFSNISADFIYGIPHHTPDIWIKNLEEIVDLKLPHYSLYQLTIEKHTPFFDFVKNGKLKPTSDLIQAKLFTETRKIMRKNKIAPYEISNFAKPGFICKHNLAYWTNQNYIGIGPSAESRIDNLAFKNSILKWDKIVVEKLTKNQKSEEIILTNLRSKYGLYITETISNVLNVNNIKKLSKYIKYNEKQNHLKMTEKGFLYFNSIIDAIIK